MHGTVKVSKSSRVRNRDTALRIWKIGPMALDHERTVRSAKHHAQPEHTKAQLNAYAYLGNWGNLSRSACISITEVISYVKDRDLQSGALNERQSEVRAGTDVSRRCIEENWAMKQTVFCPLRLPVSLKNAVAEVRREEGTSINQFVVFALAEKLVAIRTERFLAERRVGTDGDAAQRILFPGGAASGSGRPGCRWPASPARMLRALSRDVAGIDPS